MPPYFKQFGSSTLGLLAVTAIFVGLIAYATVAFEKKPEAVSVASIKTDSDQRLSTTFTEESIVEITALNESAITPEANTAVVVENQGLIVSEDELAIRATIKSTKSTVEDRLHLEQSATEQLNAQWDNNYNQYYQANGRSFGQANNTATGRGEFNFSMKLTSRARMDADSEMNSRLQQAYNASQYAQYVNYLQHNGLHGDGQRNSLY